MSGITQIKIGIIAPSNANPRRSVDAASIDELAASLKQVGMLQPIIVRPAGDGFEIVCGERRYLAAVKAKLKEVPSIVRDLTDDEAEDIRITENLQRQDINPLDEAEAYRLLVERRQYTPLMIAQRFGKSETYVRHRLQLNYLIGDFANLLQKEIISLGHALEICKLDPVNQSSLYRDDYSETGPRYYGHHTVKGLRDAITRKYSSKLSLAIFDQNEKYPCAELPCTVCPHNTAFNQLLFPEMQTEGICMNPVCYQAKSAYQFRVNLVKTVEEEPSTVLVVPPYLYGEDENDVNKLISEGLLVERLSYRNEISEPEKPDPSDYDLEDPDAMDGKVQYEADMLDYENELKEYQEKLAGGNVRKCLVVAGKDKGRYVYAEREKETDSTEPANMQLTEITELRAKDKRNAELKSEKIYFENKGLLQEKRYDRRIDPLTGTEMETLMILMLFSVKGDLAKEMGYNESNNKSRVKAAQQLTEEQRNQVFRSFILNKTDTSNPSYLKEETEMMVQIAAETYPDDAMAIAVQQNEIYQKRKKSIDQRIYDLEHMQVKAPVEDL